MSRSDPTRCPGSFTPGGMRCLFDIVPGASYCPGHVVDPKGPCDLAAVGASQEQAEQPQAPTRRRARSLDAL